MPIGPRHTGSRTTALEEKVAFLSRVDAYPERPARVETVETHMSWVFLTERHAYKLKKPVRYEYLDFSTSQARRRHCEEEVRLNRRLAPDVYLGVVPLTLDARGRLGIAGTGEAIDWLVHMRRLPRERMLDQLIGQHAVPQADARRAAAFLARFYYAAAPVQLAPDEYRARFVRGIGTNRSELLRPEFALPADDVRAIHDAQQAFVTHAPQLFDSRVEAGRIIEAHGDLRPEHICLAPEPAIIDCLEFEPDFRIQDPVDELCFLALECERLGDPMIGQLFLDSYCELAGDRPPAALVGFYKGYRACVRAKIAIWHVSDPHVREPTRWPGVARQYLELAARYSARLAEH